MINFFRISCWCMTLNATTGNFYQVWLALNSALHSAHTRAARVRQKLPLHRGYCRKKNHWDRHILMISEDVARSRSFPAVLGKQQKGQIEKLRSSLLLLSTETTDCNRHVNLCHDILLHLTFCRCFWSVDDRSLGDKPGGLLSAAAVEISSKMYLFGGFDGETQATLFRLSLPTDLCRSINTNEDCTAVRTCSWCDVYNVTQGGNDTLTTYKSACFSVTSPVPAICHVEPNVTQVKRSKL